MARLARSVLRQHRAPEWMNATLCRHFWSFESMCRANEFDKKVACTCCPIRAAPGTTRRAAARFAVPCRRGLAPAEFDHEATMNSQTLFSCAEPVHIGYLSAVGETRYASSITPWTRKSGHHLRRRGGHRRVCIRGLRLRPAKGLLGRHQCMEHDPTRRCPAPRCGRLDSPYDRLLAEANTGSVIVHGWIDSSSREYHEVLSSCRFAYIPPG